MACHTEKLSGEKFWKNECQGLYFLFFVESFCPYYVYVHHHVFLFFPLPSISLNHKSTDTSKTTCRPSVLTRMAPCNSIITVDSLCVIFACRCQAVTNPGEQRCVILPSCTCSCCQVSPDISTRCCFSLFISPLDVLVCQWCIFGG